MSAASNGLLIVAVIVVIAIVAIALVYSRRRRSAGLRDQFGPEYDRAVHDYGDQSRAESVLEARRARVENLHLHVVSNEERSHFVDAWRVLEARFVDDPRGAVADADRLIGEVMQARGFPSTDYEQRVTDLSATYPQLVDDYRTTHEIVLRSQHNENTTEDLRQAMKSFRALFGELVGTKDAEPRRAA